MSKILATTALAVMLTASAFTPAKARSGIASWYGYESGTHTADGRRFNPMHPGAAHWTLPLGTKVRVTDQLTGRSIVVTINDRGPHPRLHREIDLSLGAARMLGMGPGRRGLARVMVTPLSPYYASSE